MIPHLQSLDDLFQSDNNKKLLWDLLSEKPTFIDKINTDVINTKNSFEYILTNINTNNYTSLMDLNKVFILEILNKCNDNDFFKVNQVTNESIVNNREKIFEERLKRRQEEFSQLINKNVPNEINFQDDVTELPIDNLDSLIQNTLEKRKYDIPPDIKEKKVTFDLLNNDDVDISNDTNYIINSNENELFGKKNEENDFFGKKNEENELFGKKNEKNELFGKKNEENELFGKKNEKNELFGKKNEKNELFGKKNDFFEKKSEENAKNEKKNIFEEKMLEKMDEILQKMQKIIDTIKEKE